MNDPSSPDAHSSYERLKESYENLRADYTYLQSRVTRFASVEQDLITARHLIDLERRRFEGMRKFIRKGVRSETVRDCAQLACEGIVDILECEIGVIWLEANGKSDEVFMTSHQECLEPEAIAGLQVLIQSWRDIPQNELKARREVAESAGFREFLVHELVDDDAGRIGLMVAANSSKLADFHDRFTASTEEAFSAFAGQVGTILESRKRRETITAQVERIRLSEERLSLALAGSNVGLWDWDLANGTVYFSEQWKRMIGYSGNEITNSFGEWLDRLHPRDRDVALKAAQNCSLKVGASYDQTFRLRHRDGSWRWIVARGFTVSGSDGLPSRVIGSHIDVTGYKRLENRLRRSENIQRLAKEAALSESRAKSSFLANVSHEIRTPLNGILGVYQMLKEMPQSEMARDLIDMGEQSGMWMLEIIGESLDLARIEAGKVELAESNFDLVELIDSLLEIKRRKAIEKGLKLQLDLSPELPRRVIGDHTKLKQVLTNLIGNAIKFTEEGGVTVKVDHKVTSKPDVVQIRFRVRDSGVGIPKRSVEEVFRPFHQVDQTVTRRFGGVGLGLAIANNLTKLMKGAIRLRAPKSGGSEFSVTFPFGLATEAVPGQERAAACAIGFSGRVLVAEDDEVSRTLASRMLENLGFEVVSAPDGAVALDLFEPGKFDLVVLDCWMPRVNGLEVSLRIRDTEKASSGRVPILAMTANVQSSAAIECLQAGMDAFLGKPVSYKNLSETLAKLLPERRSFL